MTVRDLVQELIKQPWEAQVYVGKGMGPLAELIISDAGLVILSPEGPRDV